MKSGIIYERSKRQPEKGADFSNSTTILFQLFRLCLAPSVASFPPGLLGSVV
jgi:hypothetical protein